MIMSVPSLVTFGEVALDIILAGVDQVPRRWSVLGNAKAACAATAGTAGYVAQCFSKLGGRASVAGKVGRDSVGKFVLDGFHRCGVSTKNLIVDGRVATEVSTVILYNDGNKSSVVSRILPLTMADFDRNSLTKAKAFHFAGFLLYPNLWGKPALSLFKMVRKSGLLISVDPQMSATGAWTKPFKGVLEQLDILLLDEEEAKRISRKNRIPDAVEKLLEAGPSVVTVKSGARGCTVGYNGRIRNFQAFEVTPISTIGAGDAFDAAFIFGSLKNWSVEKTARFANAVAAISTTRYGCMTAIPAATNAEKLSERYYGHN
jgi:sugar/nucleoside kinase (ribokinase family)